MKNQVKYTVRDIDLSQFPKKIKLKYGEDTNRKFYEWTSKEKAIVIQKIGSNPYYVFFIDGETVRMPKEHNRDVYFATTRIEEAVKLLETLGFQVEIEEATQ